MIAVAYWEGWVRAHPVWLLVSGALAAACVLFVTAYYRLTGDPGAPRHGTRSRARGTRARRHAFLGSACRRAGAIAAWVTSWFWWLGAWHPWQALRERAALRARGITIDVAGDPTVWADRNAGRFDSALGSPVTGHASADAAGLPTLAEPARLATGAERDSAALD